MPSVVVCRGHSPSTRSSSGRRPASSTVVGTVLRHGSMMLPRELRRERVRGRPRPRPRPAGRSPAACCTPRRPSRGPRGSSREGSPSRAPTDTSLSPWPRVLLRCATGYHRAASRNDFAGRYERATQFVALVARNANFADHGAPAVDAHCGWTDDQRPRPLSLSAQRAVVMNSDLILRPFGSLFTTKARRALRHVGPSSQ